MTTATTIVQTQTVADTTTGWSQPLGFVQFDPSLGTLIDVRIGVAGTVNATASIEDLGAAATAVGVSIPVNFNLLLPDGSERVSIAVDPTTTVNLARTTARLITQAVPVPLSAVSSPAATPSQWAIWTSAGSPVPAMSA